MGAGREQLVSRVVGVGGMQCFYPLLLKKFLQFLFC